MRGIDQALVLMVLGILVMSLLVQEAGADSFAIGDSVRTTMDGDVTGNPGIPEADPTVMWKGNTGTITDGPVEAGGSRWWQISYDVGVSGWSPEGSLGAGFLEPAPEPPQPPEGFASRAESAISWARHREGRDDWNFLCMKFVVNAFMRQEGAAAGGNADDFARSLDRFGQEPGGWHSAPRGAVLFFEGRGSNAYGHAAIYLGNGQTIDAFGRVGEHSLVEFAEHENVGRYLGWAYPPATWSPAVPPVHLTVSVHDRSVSGPPLTGVQVTGTDGTGTSFDTTTDAAGVVVIDGDPGEWHLTSSGSGYGITSSALQVLRDDTQDMVLLPLPAPLPDGLPGRRQGTRGMAELPDSLGYFVIALYTGILVVPLFPARNPTGSERIRQVKQIVDTSQGYFRGERPAVRPVHGAGPHADRDPSLRKNHQVEHMSFIFNLLFK